jgi:Bacteriodetes cell division protein (FtsL-like)
MNKLKETETAPEAVAVQATEPVVGVRNDWRSVVGKLSYRAMFKNIPYFAFVVTLCMIYIGNSHHAIEVQREMNQQSKALKELRWKYMDVKTQLTHAGMETEIMKNAANIGLKPSALPVFKLIDADTTTSDQRR